MAAQAPQLDHSWRKDTILPVGRGYGVRSGKPSAIVIHTTSSPIRNTKFASEALYLRDSTQVSAHYLVGKQGQIAQILHPDLEAWHAGVSVAAFNNEHSIGIENHVSQGEAWTDEQHAALTWLVRWLMALYVIPAQMVETHRKIALPAGRKSDPAGWDDAAFYAWRAGLIPVSPPQPPIETKRYRARRILISQRQEGGPPYAGELLPGDEVVADKWYSNNKVHLQDGRGFVDLKDLEQV
jgi:hypothetical protein